MQKIFECGYVWFFDRSQKKVEIHFCHKIIQILLDEHAPAVQQLRRNQTP